MDEWQLIFTIRNANNRKKNSPSKMSCSVMNQSCGTIAFKFCLSPQVLLQARLAQTSRCAQETNRTMDQGGCYCL